MGFKRFSVLLTIRLLFLFSMLTVLTIIILQQGYYASTLLILLVVLVQVFDIVRFVKLTNKEIGRFLDALRYGDFSQKFENPNMGAGFGELGHAFTEIVEKFRLLKSQQEVDLKHFRALIEHVPVPLMSVYGDGVIELHNNAARRLFGTKKARRLSDLNSFGADFQHIVATVAPGERHSVAFVADDTEQTLTIASTQVLVEGRIERLISLQDIQSELDSAQLKAWQDLVRVLTHEIMNSITPVASLSKTSIDLVDDAIKKAEGQEVLVQDLEDVRDAVATVSRRSDGLMHFVQSYRRLTRLPPPEKRTVKIKELIDRVSNLVTADWPSKGIVYEAVFSANTYEVSVDPDMVEQVLINLLQNAEQAVQKTENPKVRLSVRASKRGRVVVEIADNGPGVAPDLESKIFVPFFTTKREGSGVGLALSRQVMIAHGGSITLVRGEQNGATFVLTF